MAMVVCVLVEGLIGMGESKKQTHRKTECAKSKNSAYNYLLK